MRRWLLGAMIVGGGLCVLALAAVLALPYIELGPFVAGRLAGSLGRSVKVGSTRVTPGRWITVRVRDMVVANMPGGTRPEMATLAAAEAEVNLWSLVQGPVLLRRLRVEKFDLLLEKVGEARQPNWRLGPPHDATEPDYGWLPTFLDADLAAQVTFRTSSGHPLVTVLDGVHIAANDAASPVRVTGPGSYQGVPMALDVTFASFDALRAAPEPVATGIRLTSTPTVLTFKGKMRAPLAMDGAQGELSLDAPTPDAILRIAGLEPAPFPASRLLGTLDREGTTWHLANTVGALGTSAVQGGDILLNEGSPDRIALALQFDKLDAGALLGKGKADSSADTPIVPDAAPSILLDVKLSAASVAYAAVALSDVSLDASLQPGVVAMETLGFGALGGQMKASGRIVAAEQGKSSHVSAEMEATGLEVQALRRALGAGAVPLAGRVTGRVRAEADGATLNQATRGARVALVATMQGGSVSRELIELASTDARTLFRSAQGMVAISCALAIMDLKGGVGTVSPLRVRSAAGTVAGRGRIDLNRRTLDLTVASEGRTTGFFALDVPVRISGAFDDPSVVPATLSAQGRAQLAASDSVARLPADMREAARQSPCLERGR